MNLARGGIVLTKVLIVLAALLVVITGGYLYLTRKSDRDTTSTENVPHVPNAYLLISIVDKKGDPVPDCTLIINIKHEPPNDIYDYGGEVELAQATGNMVGLSLPPLSALSTVKIVARRPCGSTSNEYSITNTEYWQKVEDSTTGYAEEVTFAVGDCE